MAQCHNISHKLRHKGNNMLFSFWKQSFYVFFCVFNTKQPYNIIYAVSLSNHAINNLKLQIRHKMKNLFPNKVRKTLLRFYNLETLTSHVVQHYKLPSLFASSFVFHAVLSCFPLFPHTPAEIKGFWHCAHVHIGMPWHMFESERNM